MTFKKARFATAAVMVLLAAVSVFILRGSMTAFRVLEGFFAVYGFIRFGTDFCRWLQLPDRPEQRRGRRQANG